MDDVIRREMAALVALCPRLGVKSLSVFGSAASGRFDPAKSDVDLLVEFEPMSTSDHAEAFFSLLEEAEEIFGRKVDLVEPQALRNPFIRRRVEATREVVYGS